MESELNCSLVRGRTIDQPSSEQDEDGSASHTIQ